MANITAEQALQIPQQLKRQGSQAQGGAHPVNPGNSDGKGSKFLSDDAVTLQNSQPSGEPRSIEVDQYKRTLGADMLFVKETIRNKLSEYGLNPNAKLAVSKDLFGQIAVTGPASAADLERISTDLNKSKAFQEAFGRLSQQQPTLSYMDNVVKISKAYGVGNSLFNSLISETQEFNKLSDIAHRYNSMRTATATDFSDDTANAFKFNVNA